MKKGPIGIFDVYADEWVIYSNRWEGGRLPQKDEIVAKIREYQSRPFLAKKGARPKSEAATAEGCAPEATSGSQCGCG